MSAQSVTGLEDIWRLFHFMQRNYFESTRKIWEFHAFFYVHLEQAVWGQLVSMSPIWSDFLEPMLVYWSYFSMKILLQQITVLGEKNWYNLLLSLKRFSLQKDKPDYDFGSVILSSLEIRTIMETLHAKIRPIYSSFNVKKSFFFPCTVLFPYQSARNGLCSQCY